MKSPPLRPGDTANRQNHLPWDAVALLSLASFVCGAVIRLIDPMLPRLTVEYQASIADVSWVATATLIAYGLLQMLFGPLGDRHGKLRVIGYSTVAAAGASMLCALADTLPMLIAARVLLGASCACIIPLSMAWIGDVVPFEFRQPVLARYLIGQILGVALGLGVGGVAAEQASWQWPFWACAALFAISGLGLLLYATRSPAASAGRSGKLLEELIAVAATPWARVVLLTVLCEGLAVMGAITFVATHLHRQGGLSLSAAGAILVAFAAGGLSYAFTAHRVATRAGESGLIRIGTISIAASLLLIGLLPQIVPATLATFMLGFGFYMFHNTLQFNATQMAPDRRGAAVALFATCFFIGQSLGTAAAGMLVEHFGTRPVMFTAAAGMLPLGLRFAQKLRHRIVPTVAARALRQRHANKIRSLRRNRRSAAKTLGRT